MRVLFAIAHVDKGGGQVIQCLQLFRRLQSKVDGELLALTSHSSAGSAPEANVRLVGELRFPSGVLQLRRAIRERLRSVDVVQAFDFYYSLPAARFARAQPLVVRSGAHPVEDFGSRYGTIGRVAMRVANPWLYSDTTIVVNAQHLVRAYRGPNVVCIPNGVDMSRFPSPRDPVAARRELGLPPDAPIVAYTGKIIPRKNVEDLYWLARAEPRLHLLLVGNDNEPFYGDRYHRRVRAAFPDILPRAHTTGEVPSARIPRYLEAADVFVFPSGLEGMPNSILEAMAAGLPIVAADTPAHRELVRPEFGVLYRTREELRQSVRDLLESTEKARAYGTRARGEAAEKHSLDAAADAYLRLYREVANGGTAK